MSIIRNNYRIVITLSLLGLWGYALFALYQFWPKIDEARANSYTTEFLVGAGGVIASFLFALFIPLSIWAFSSLSRSRKLPAGASKRERKGVPRTTNFISFASEIGIMAAWYLLVNSVHTNEIFYTDDIERLMTMGIYMGTYVVFEIGSLILCIFLVTSSRFISFIKRWKEGKGGKPANDMHAEDAQQNALIATS